MTAGPSVPSPSLKLPELITLALSSGVIQQQPEKHTPAPAEVVTRTNAGRGKRGKVTANVPPTRSLSLPMPRSGDELAVGQEPSLLGRGSLLRRRSGDFSLPVRYKVRDGPDSQRGVLYDDDRWVRLRLLALPVLRIIPFDLEYFLCPLSAPPSPC